MENQRLYIAMVGLPARGKSTIATKLKESLVHESVKARIFNNGDLRRKTIRENTSYAGFFDSNNSEGVAIREQIALTNMERAQKFLSGTGNVAILDASNISRDRRERIQSRLNDHPILFIECVNNNEEILSASILRKIDLDEFGHLTREEAIKGFRERISSYQSIEEPLESERNYIRLDSLHNRVIEEEISDNIPYYEQIRDFLVTNTVKSLFLIRHGESYYNTEDRIGGDSDLTEKGLAQAVALADYFKQKRIPLIFTSQKKRTQQTASPIKEAREDCTIIPLAEFDEINSGICECMSYKRIRAQMPQVYAERRKDKYNYVYPEGEGYATMQERINRGIKKALYLSNPSDNIMIVGHRAVNRMILSHFMFRREEDVPFIYIPQDKFYYICTTQSKKHFQLKKFK